MAMQPGDESPATTYHIHAQHTSAVEQTERTDISKKLRDIDALPPGEQAQFWMSCVNTGSKQIEAIGGLAPDEVFNDVVKRYFDSSVQQLDSVFDLCLRDQQADPEMESGTLSKDGVKDAMVEHFQYYRLNSNGEFGPEAQECFDRLCETIEIPATRESFAYSIRRIRLALLLKLHHLVETSKEVYHIDYDDDFIYTGNSNAPTLKHKSHEYRKVWCRSRKYKIPKLDVQKTVTDLPEYLFTSRLSRQGKVHWVHVHNKRIQMVLALGQVYRMPGRIVTAMRNLRGSLPRVRLSQSRLMERKGTELGRRTMGHQLTRQTSSILPDHPDSDEWSSLTYPGMCLDYASRKSLQHYERWCDAKKNPLTRSSVPEEPPRVFVASVEFTVGMIWSDPKTKTVVSMCSDARYIGKWASDVPTDIQKSRWERFAEFLSCSRGCLCCCRRQDGYELISQEDDQKDADEFETERSDERMRKPDVEHGEHGDEEEEDCEMSFSRSMRHMTVDDENVILDETPRSESGMDAIDPVTSCITFDGIFEKTLLALESQNSVLRTGNNEQLMTRIMLNSTQEYLDIASTYAAAIHRLGYLLNTPGVPNKDNLIARIESARYELEQLVGLVSPFAQNVLPILRELNASNEIVNFQIEGIDDNVSAFIPKCESLIQQCQSLAQQYDRKASDRMNSILNVLTFITFVIIPMQLLTGLYGMNFKVMPELEWHHGYKFFWALSITLSLFFAVLLYRFTQED